MVHTELLGPSRAANALLDAVDAAPHPADMAPQEVPTVLRADLTDLAVTDDDVVLGAAVLIQYLVHSWAHETDRTLSGIIFDVRAYLDELTDLDDEDDY